MVIFLLHGDGHVPGISWPWQKTRPHSPNSGKKSSKVSAGTRAPGGFVRISGWISGSPLDPMGKPMGNHGKIEVYPLVNLDIQ